MPAFDEVLERVRLAAVECLDLGDLEGTAYDAIIGIAARVCEAPIAVISVVGRSRELFKSRTGTELTEWPRALSFCTHAIKDPERVTIIEDTTQDERFVNNPAVTGYPHIRFYAGVPLIFQRQAIGTICVFDTKPRMLDLGQVAELRFLAKRVIETLTERRRGGPPGRLDS